MKKAMAPARGFTLIELLLVMAILATLAAVIVPRFTNRAKEARVTAARTEIASLQLCLDPFEIDTGSYPTTEQGLAALLECPTDVSADDWHGPYLNHTPKDPWGTLYVYKCPGDHNTNGYDLHSLGPDKQDGTDDDINNWS